MPTETELELIAQAQRGDRQAFGELVRCHREGVINVVYRMCGDANLAEDAAQEAFISAWQQMSAERRIAALSDRQRHRAVSLFCP